MTNSKIKKISGVYCNLVPKKVTSIPYQEPWNRDLKSGSGSAHSGFPIPGCPPQHTAISLSYTITTSISLYELFLIFLISVTDTVPRTAFGSARIRILVHFISRLLIRYRYHDMISKKIRTRFWSWYGIGMGSVCVWPDFALPSPDPDLSSLFHGSWYGTDVTFLGTKLQ